MTGARISIDYGATLGNLAGMAGRAEGLSGPMKVIAALVLASVQRNFEVGGRPAKWAPLKPSTLKKRKSGGGPLVVKGFGGGLLGSVNAQSDSTSASVGTNKIYAATHQFGARKGSFGQALAGDFRRTGFLRGVERGGGNDWSAYRSIPWGDIPARPYLLVQETDSEEILEVLANHVLGGPAGAAR